MVPAGGSIMSRVLGFIGVLAAVLALGAPVAAAEGEVLSGGPERLMAKSVSASQVTFERSGRFSVTSETAILGADGARLVLGELDTVEEASRRSVLVPEGFYYKWEPGPGGSLKVLQATPDPR